MQRNDNNNKPKTYRQSDTGGKVNPPRRKKAQRVPNNKADPFANPQSMERHAKHIFRDIAFGSCDIGLNADIFKEPAFLHAAIEVSSRELSYALIHKTAMEYTYHGSSDFNVKQVYDADVKKVSAWSIIYDTLLRIQQTGDIGYLVVLANRLPPLKFYL